MFLFLSVFITQPACLTVYFVDLPPAQEEYLHGPEDPNIYSNPIAFIRFITPMVNFVCEHITIEDDGEDFVEAPLPPRHSL